MSVPRLDGSSSASHVVAVEDLVRSLPDLRILVPGPVPHQPIRWVHVSELTDPTPYLRGRELLLSAGVHLPKSAAATEEYVARLTRAGVIGLGFGVDPVYRKVPPRLVAACRANELLLVEVPPSVPFVAISEVHVRALEEARVTAAESSARAQRTIVRAAARSDPLQAVVSAVSSHLRASTVLEAPQEGRRWSAGPAVPAAEQAISQLLAKGQERLSIRVHEPGGHVVAQLLDVAARPMVLAVGSPGPLPPGTGNLVTIAASVVSLVAGHVSTARLGALAEAVTRAATGSDQASLEGSAAQALRRGTGEQWRVLACAPGRGLTRAGDLQRWRDHVAVSVRTVLRLDDGDSVVALIPERAAPEKVAKDLASGSDVVALSDPCRWPALPAATRQARRRLAAARVEAPAGPRLRDLIDREAAEGFAEAVLGPVLDRPAHEAAGLLATLRAWLAHGGNWDRTAAALGVHRNTVRNRLAKVASLVGRDLQEPRLRVDLWLALEWYDAAHPDALANE